MSFINGAASDIILKQTILELTYPVGSIYMSENSTSPNELFGGSWEQITDKFILAAGNEHIAGETGGSETVTLSINEIPSHRHFVFMPNANGDVGTYTFAATTPYTTTQDDVANTSSVGGGAAHNNMPPYLVAYMWKRVS